MKKVFKTFVSLLLLFSITACGAKNKDNSSSISDQTNETNTISENETVLNKYSIAIKDGITTLDPAFTDGSDSTIVYHLLEGLYKYDQAGSITYGIAEKESVSEGGKVWTFTIRKDAVWSDGTPVKASDFVFAWQRAVDPKVGSPYASLFLDILNASDILEGKKEPSSLGVEAISDTELKVTFKDTQFKTSNLFIHNVFMPLRSDIISEQITADVSAASETDKISANSAWSLNKALYLTNGAYTLESLSNENTVLKSSSTYYDNTHVTADTLEFISYDNITAVYEDFSSGLLAFSDYVDSSTVSAMYGTDDSPLKASSTLGTEYVTINNGSGVLSYFNVRKALLLCVNQNDISNELLNIFYPATGFMSSAFSGENRGESFRVAAGFTLSYSDAAYTENVELAQNCLAEAGFSDGKTFPELEFIYNSDSSIQQQIVISLVRCWNEKLGITVHANGLNTEEYNKRIADGDYELAMTSTESQIDDPMQILENYVTGLTSNTAHISDYNYDSYIDQALKAYDYSEYLTCLEQADIEIVKNALLIPVGFKTELYIQSDSLNNVVITVTGNKIFTFSTIE